ncbi:MAG: UDP-N-acetylmuramate--L-alanine ligase [Geminocystis sp.]|nr:UDP-N-acetylmuramate--L-alanine ligase [Geminocystis sp.]MDW8463751.1 UDP-N-acetylmuramate--L-alanine ligase [Geminocystis sp.]
MSELNLKDAPFHFIGIGGIGMSALAYVLAKRGLRVSGSDLRASHITYRLQELGVTIFTEQSGANFEKLDNNFPGLRPQVICSTAIGRQNSEFLAAKKRGYPIFHRADVLAALMKGYCSIAVAGTHGKTTTSSLISYIVWDAGLDPTVIIGGEVSAWEGNARLGNGNYLVAEADESDGSLVKYSPHIGVITNIEWDHPDHYQSIEQLVDIFQKFARQCKTVIACVDCPVVAESIQADITYSIRPDSGADYTATNIVHSPFGSQAEIWENGSLLGSISLLLSGSHNISNSLAAIAVARKLGLDFPTIARALAKFEGAKRRFEYRGNYRGATLIDDYAHHPSEIRCTISAARSRLPQYEAERIVAVFQPHRYTRTAVFLEEFASSFQQADVLVLTDIYSAGEAPIEGVTGEKLADCARKYHPRVYYHPQLSNLKDFLSDFLQKGDLVLFMGAGNLNQIIPILLSLDEKSLPQAA